MNDENYGGNYYSGNTGEPPLNQTDYNGNADLGYARQEYGYNQDPGYAQQGYGYTQDPGYTQQGYGYTQDPGYTQQGYGYTQGQGYPGYINNMPAGNEPKSGGSSKKVLMVVTAGVVIVLAAVIFCLVLYFTNKNNTAQKAYSDLLTDLIGDPEDFFSDIDELSDYDFSDLNIGSDEFSIVDTDGDDVPELIINVTSPGLKNSFALVYDYNDSDNPSLRSVMSSDPKFYTGNLVVTSTDVDGAQATLIEEYNSSADEYESIARYYDSGDGNYFVQEYSRNDWSTPEEYTYDELTVFLDDIYGDSEEIIFDYKKINVGNVSNISKDDGINPKTEKVNMLPEPVAEAEPDYDMLVNTFPGSEYDCTSSNSGELALEFLTEGLFGTAQVYLSPSEYSTVRSVPGVSDGGYSSYTKYSEDSIDNLIKSVYNTNAPSHRSSYEYPDGDIYAYYVDGYYYAGIPGGHDGPGYEVNDHTVGSDGRYTITVAMWSDAEIVCYYTVIAKPAQINGKSAWIYYSITEEEQEEEKSVVTGRVCDSDNYAIADATVKAYSTDGDVMGTVETDSDGYFRFELEPGRYDITASASGYEPMTQNDIIVDEDDTVYTENFVLIGEDENSSYTVSGQIIDASTGVGISGATIKFTGEDDDSYRTTTDSSGNYSISLPSGYYVASLTKSGYIDTTFNVISSEEKADSDQDYTMSKVMAGGTYRIVLTWDEDPRDLDSHVTGPLSDGSTFHIYFEDKSAYDGSTEVANLDLDDTSSYGPETITLNPVASGSYKYYVHRFNGDGSISTSNAVVKVYRGDTLVATYYAPTDQGTGNYWTVFEINNGSINTINKVGNSVY